jgi:hypothetical protein
MPIDNNALVQLSEKMRGRQQQGGISGKQLNWLVDGYNLGLLDAEECKTRFGKLIDELEQKKEIQ